MKPLHELRVAKPCHEDWNAMTGDAKSRFCDKCKKSVHNLTEMTESEAAELLNTAAVTPCVRFAKDEKGEPIFKGSRAWLALLAAGALSAGCREPFTATTGEVACPPDQSSVTPANVWQEGPTAIVPESGVQRDVEPVERPDPSMEMGEVPVKPRPTPPPKVDDGVTMGVMAPVDLPEPQMTMGKVVNRIDQ